MNLEPFDIDWTALRKKYESSLDLDQESDDIDLKAFKKKYGSFFDSVSLVLFEADPADLNYQGTNTDEYDAEAATIILRLPNCNTLKDTHQVVYEEFCRWFDDEETVGHKGKYRLPSMRIWNLWRQFNDAGHKSV